MTLNQAKKLKIGDLLVMRPAFSEEYVGEVSEMPVFTRKQHDDAREHRTFWIGEPYVTVKRADGSFISPFIRICNRLDRCFISRTLAA